MKRKYTLEELKELNDNNKLEGKDLGGGIKIEVIDFGWYCGYGICKEGVLVCVSKPFRLTLGLLRELNRLLMEE